jgi:hypothetical protein
LKQHWHGGQEIIRGSGLYIMNNNVDRRNLVKRQVMGNTIEGWIYQPKGPPHPPYFFLKFGILIIIK